MGFPDYKKDLSNGDLDVNYLLDRYFHSGQSAVFAGASPDVEARLKNEIGSALFRAFAFQFHPFQLVVCGSAHLGFSPVPTATPDKFGKSFDPRTSDIDVAVISPELFDAWWSELQVAGLDERTRTAISEDLFWGFINPANARGVSERGNTWWNLFGGLKTDRAAGVRGRLYRSFWAMQSYHRLAVVRGRRRLLDAVR